MPDHLAGLADDRLGDPGGQPDRGAPLLPPARGARRERRARHPLAGLVAHRRHHVLPRRLQGIDARGPDHRRDRRGPRQDAGPGDAALAPAAGTPGHPEVRHPLADRGELRRLRLRPHRRRARRHRRPRHRHPRRPRPGDRSPSRRSAAPFPKREQETTMQIDPRPATTKNPPEILHRRRLARPHRPPRDDGQRMFVAKVRFAPGARTAWHSHARGQTLHITSGVAWVQSRGEDKLVAYPGQTLYCPPGQEHWHGAAPDSFMEHLAMIDNADDPAAEHDLARARQRRGVPRRRLSMSWDERRARPRRHRDGARPRGATADESLSRFTTMWVVRVGDEPVRPLGLRTRQRLVPPRDPAGSRPRSAPAASSATSCSTTSRRTTRCTPRSTRRSTPSTTRTARASSPPSSEPTPPR